jgi:hypothetical protein
MDLNKIRVACTTLGNRLVIARFGKDESLSLDQRDAEKDILIALRDYMMRDSPKGSIKKFSVNGQEYELTLKPKAHAGPQQ